MRLMGIACRTLFALVIVSAWPAHRADAAKVDVYALVGARLVTMNGATIDNGTIVLRDGVIEAVGATGKVAVPPDARVLDAKGLTVTPGLIDAFGGLGLPAQRPPAALGGGVPTVVAPAPMPTPNALQPQAVVLERVRAQDALRARDQGVTTALVVPREGVLPGRSAIINLSGNRPDHMALRQPAAMHLHMSTAGRGYPTALMGTMAYARQQLLDAKQYRESWALYEKAPLGRKRPHFDAALAAWEPVLEGKLPLMVTGLRENDIRRALALADEFGVKVTVAGALRAFKVAPLIKQRRVPLVVSVNFDPPRAAAAGGGGDDDRERRDIDEAQKNPAELHKAGVPFALGSAYGSAFLPNVRKVIEAGLPREAALRALTVEAARALGIADRTGTLERGKLANVVAWSGDPLDRRAKVKLVFVDGQLYEPIDRPERPRGAGGAEGEGGGEERRETDPFTPTPVDAEEAP
jgi:imidazolonepropionase-like amidohydrolase